MGLCVGVGADGIVYKRHFSRTNCDTIDDRHLFVVIYRCSIDRCIQFQNFSFFFSFPLPSHTLLDGIFLLWTHHTGHGPRAARWTRGHREAILATMDSVSMASMRQVCMDRSTRFARAVTAKINSTIRRIHCMEERTCDFLYAKGRWIYIRIELFAHFIRASFELSAVLEAPKSQVVFFWRLF